MRGQTCVLLTIVLAAAAPDQTVAEWKVWTVTETRRVLRDDMAEDAVDVHLAAARGEWESFQILLRSEHPVRGTNIVAGDLVGPDGVGIPASTARLYRQHQFHLTVPTHRNDAFRPGWYPDALIPFKHPMTHQTLSGERFAAVPFDLPASETHGFWVDLLVPTDAEPGEYRGTYRVTVANGGAVEIPVVLKVWDFALPRVSTLQTALGSPADRMRSYYGQRARNLKEPPPDDWAAVHEQCAEMLSRHRINATPSSGSLAPVAQPDGSFRIPDDQIDAFRQFVDRHHVNAFRVPHPRSAVKDPVEQRERAALHAWLKSWDRAAEQLDRPDVVFYIYLKDEPNEEEAYHYVQKWGRAIREAKSVVKVMVVEQTWTQNEAWGDLYGAIDIWCPLFPLFKAESAAKRQALGETIWTYTALCQRDKTPWWHTDFPLLNYRVPTWIAWRYRMRGLLYWGGMSYWRGVEDPWTEPGTLDRRERNPMLMYNGEGSLLYPGRAVGYDGIAPSLRVKALRDAIEDYEYLAILEGLGRAEQAEKVIKPLAESWFQWETNPEAYQKAREELAGIIVNAR